MNAKALQTLEYPKIIEQLAARATSPLGRALCLGLLPGENIDTIRACQANTRDALSRLFAKGSLSLGAAKDLGASLKRLEIGSSLSMAELLDLAALLENAARAKSYGRREGGDVVRDTLDDLFDALEPLTPLSTEIRRCILTEEEMANDASAALKQIRRSIRISGDRIHSQLQSFLNGSARTYLQDGVITMRGGRYCIPVKAEYKNQVPGMIHDQ